MTQADALQSLITFAPDYDFIINQVASTYKGKVCELSYTLSLHKDNCVKVFLSSCPAALVYSAKNFIYTNRIEETLTQPIHDCI